MRFLNASGMLNLSRIVCSASGFMFRNSGPESSPSPSLLRSSQVVRKLAHLPVARGRPMTASSPSRQETRIVNVGSGPLTECHPARISLAKEYRVPRRANAHSGLRRQLLRLNDFRPSEIPRLRL